MVHLITVESLKNEIEFLKDLQQGFIDESNRRAVIRTQRTINFKKEQMMELIESGEEAIEILI